MNASSPSPNHHAIRNTCIALRRRVPVLVCVLCLVTSAGLPAKAVPIQYDFQAQITGGNNGDGLLDATGLSLGAIISGFFSVETTATDANPSANLGRYPGGIVGAEVQLGLLRFVYTPVGAPTNNAYFVDNLPFGGPLIDGYAAQVVGAGAALGATAYDSGDFEVYLASSDTTIFSSDAIPASVPLTQAAAFDQLNQLTLRGFLSGQTFQIDAVITQIPEPSTALLLASGLVGLASRRRIRAH